MKFTMCIPTLNASSTWGAFAAAIKSQTMQPAEVIVIDSSSSDNTVALARQEGYRVIQIARKDFHHGATRQYGAEMAEEGEILVYLTQDAQLADQYALEQLMRAFENPSVGAAFGRQLPRDGAKPIEAHARLFNYPAVSSLRSADSVAELGLKSIFFSNSFGAYRRRALQQVGGFSKEVNFGEDTVVAGLMLQRGWQLAYVAEAQVFHSHAYSCKEEMRRYVEVGKLHRRESWILDKFGGASKAGLDFALSQIEFLAKRAPSHIPEAIVRTGLKYVGYRLGRRGPAGRRRLAATGFHEADQVAQ
jgi:rhamnosyltransferase